MFCIGTYERKDLFSSKKIENSYKQYFKYIHFSGQTFNLRSLFITNDRKHQFINFLTAHN